MYARPAGRESKMANARYTELRASGKLPSPDGTALELIRLADDPGATIEAITAVIEADPATAARVLEYVNSSFAGLWRRVSSVQTAVTLVGMVVVQSIALSVQFMTRATRDCKGFDDGFFWSDSLARAVACRHLCGQGQAVSSDQAFTCALLSQIGRLAFAAAYPQTYGEMLREVDPADPEALTALEREVFEIDHDALAALLMADWHLPEGFREAVRNQSSPLSRDLDQRYPNLTLATMLNLSATVAPLLTTTGVSRGCVRRFLGEFGRVGLSPERVEPLFETIATDWRQMGSVFSVRTRKPLTIGELYAHGR